MLIPVKELRLPLSAVICAPNVDSLFFGRAHTIALSYGSTPISTVVTAFVMYFSGHKKKPCQF